MPIETAPSRLFASGCGRCSSRSTLRRPEFTGEFPRSSALTPQLTGLRRCRSGMLRRSSRRSLTRRSFPSGRGHSPRAS